MKEKFFGYKAAISAIVITFLVGMNFGAYSIGIPVLMQKFNASATAAGFGGTLETYACCIVSILFAGVVINKLGAKRCVLISGIICGCYAFVYIFAPSLVVVYIFEVFVGTSQAIGYITGMNAFISKWFIDKRETVIGIGYAFVGFGGALGVLLLGAIQQKFGLSIGGYVFSIAAVISIILYFLFLKDPEDVGQKALGWEKAEEVAKATGAEEGTDYGVGLKGALKSPSLYLMLSSTAVWGLAMIIFGYEIVVFEAGGVSAIASSRYNSLSLAALALLSIIMGKATNKFGLRAYAFIAFGSAIIGLASMAVWTGSHAAVLLVLSAVFIGGGYSVGGTIGGMMTTQMFGTKDFEKITPIVYSMRSIGLGTGVFILPHMADKMGSWTIPCWTGVGLLAVALILTLLAIAMSPMKKLMKTNNVNAE